MRIVDAHLDIAWNALGLGRDPTLPVVEARRREAGTPLPDREGEITVGLPDLRRAGAAVVFGTLFVLPCGAASTIEGVCYSTSEEANQQGWEQLHYYRQLEQAGELRVISSRAHLNASLQDGRLGLVMLMEGADPISSTSELQQWYAAGLRIVGLSWRQTRFAGGTGAPGPLTDAGRELLAEMDRLGMALDVSHLAEESFWQALELFKGPVLASHANSRAFVPTDRHLSDDMVRAIVERDGLIGVLPHTGFLVADHDGRKDSVGLEHVLRHIEHICELAGDRRHIGLGSDFDGGFGRQGIPRELDSWADLPLLGDALRGAGWSPDEVEDFMGRSWLRWLEHLLPER